MSHSDQNLNEFLSQLTVKQLNFHPLILSFCQQEKVDPTCTQATHSRQVHTALA